MYEHKIVTAHYAARNDGQPWYRNEWEDATHYEFSFFVPLDYDIDRMLADAQDLVSLNVPEPARYDVSLLAITDQFGSEVFGLTADGEAQMAWAQVERDEQYDNVREPDYNGGR